MFPTCNSPIETGASALCKGTLIPTRVEEMYTRSWKIYWKCTICGRSES